MEGDPVHVLVVTDDAPLTQHVDELLRDEGPAGASADHVEDLAALETKTLAGEPGSAWEGGVVLVDLAADGTGLGEVETVADDLGAPVVALTPPGAADQGGEAVARGAQDHLPRDGLRGDVLRRTLRHARERQSLRNEVRKKASVLESTLESITEGVLVVDLDGNVIRYNDRFQALWGIPDDVAATGDDEALLQEATKKLADPEPFRERVQELYANPAETSFELIEFEDGRILERYSRPCVEDGEIVGRVWTFRDVTERERTEAALRESEERFRSLYENATIGMYRTTPGGEVILANPALLDMLGYDSLEGLAETDLEGAGYHPIHSREAWRDEIDEEGEIRGFETTWETRDGETIHVRESARAVEDDDGNVRYYEGTIEDITDRREAERKLERQNDLLEDLHEVSLRLLEHRAVDDVLEEIVERASDLLGTELGWIFVRAPGEDEMQLRYSTDPLEEFHGLSHGRGEGHAGTVWETREPLLVEAYDDWERRAEEFPEGILGTVAGVPLATGDEILGVLSVGHPGAEEGFTDEELAALERFGALASLALENARLLDDMQAEIRERRETQEALRRSEERHRTIVEAAPDMVWSLDLDGTIQSLNPAVEEITGWDPDELEGASFFNLVHPDDLEELRRKFEDLLQGADRAEAEIRGRTPDGGYLTLHVVGAPRRLDGEIQGVMGIARDVTDRKERERELAESRARLKRAQAVGEIGDWTWYESEVHVRLSEEMRDLWGIPAEKKPLVADDVLERVHPDDREDLAGALERSYETGEDEGVHHRILRPDGEVRWMESRIEAVTGPDGDVARLRGTSQDITDFKRSQMELAERTRSLETLVSNLPGVAYRCRQVPGWPMEEVRGEAEDLTGYTASAIESDDVSYGKDVIHPDDREQVWREVEAAVEADEPFEIVYRIVRADGETRWVWERGRAIEDPDAQETVLEGFITDITERRELEEELRESEARYRNLVEAAPDVIYTLDREGTIRSLNQAFEDITGWDPDEWEGRHFSELVSDEDLDEAREAFGELQCGNAMEAEIRFRTRDGVVVGHVVGVPMEEDDAFDGFLGVARDITDRVEAQEELRESEARYRRLVEGMPDPVCTIRPDGTLDSVNPAWTEVTGRTADDLADRPLEEVIHEDDVEEALRAFGRVLDGEQAETEIRIRTADGGTFWGHGVGVPLFEGGEVEKVLGVFRDVTDRREAQERLRTVKNFNQTLLENAPVGIAHLAEDGAITYQNRELRRIRGVAGESQDPLDDTPIQEFGPVVERPDLQARIKVLLREGIPFTEYQSPFQTADGEEVHLALTGVPIGAEDGDVDGAILLARDVTEERELEREVERQTIQLVHSEKMAALGHLVAGITHEINNPLSVVQSNTELLKETADRLVASPLVAKVAQGEPVDGAELAEHLQEEGDGPFLFAEGPDLLERNLESLERISEFIESLRTLASPDRERTPADLNQVLRDTVELFLAQYREEVDLRTHFGDLPPVPCHESQVGQVAMNLLLNAAQASPEGGTVELRSRRDGDEAVVEVEDEGEGIPEEDQDDVFDPFYSTKEDDNMGLGLSISDHIIADHDGDIELESTPGDGAVFRVRLPLQEAST